jgi:hypothetical protein
MYNIIDMRCQNMMLIQLWLVVFIRLSVITCCRGDEVIEVEIEYNLNCSKLHGKARLKNGKELIRTCRRTAPLVYWRLLTIVGD